MRLIVDPRIFDQFPDVLLGVVTLHNVNNHGDVETISQLLRTAEQEALRKLGAIPLSEHPNISPWRDAYRKFGAKPKDYPSSIENLARRVSKGEQVRRVNKLVDLYNVISLRHLLPVGGEDTDKIRGDIILAFAGDAEQAVVMLGEREARSPYANEVIYRDDNGAICRRWNWKEADRTKLTEATTNAFMVSEVLPPVTREELGIAVAELAGLIERYCGGDIAATILDRNHTETAIS